MKYRICYEKINDLIFISQLDVQKVFHRSFKRAGIKLAFSSGFNPHPKMHFSPPMPLFASSSSEYLDFETKEDIDKNELINKLNKALPKDMQILRIEKLYKNNLNLSKSILCAKYELNFNSLLIDEELNNEIKNFINNSEEIILKKKNKKGILKEENIKPFIYEFEIKSNNPLIIQTTLSLSSDKILSPSSLINILKEKFEILNNTADITVTKLKTNFIN